MTKKVGMLLLQKSAISVLPTLAVCLPRVTFLPAIPVCLPYTVTSLPFIPVFFVVVFLYAIAVFSVIPLFRCSFPPPISVLPAVPLLLAI